MALLAASTYPELLGAAVREAADRVFLRCASERTAPDALDEVTFDQLWRRSRRVAAGLLARGIRPGERIAVAAPNQAEWLELFFGAASIGAVLVTLNVRYRESELDYMLNQAEVRLLVTAARAGDMDFEAFYPGFRSRVPSLEHVLYLGGTGDGERFGDLPGDPADPGELDRLAGRVRSADPAVILYTSGTTGRPKGAVLTHGSLIAAASGQAKRLGTGPDDVCFSAMPLNHVGGITCSMTSALVGGSQVVLAPMFSPASALDAVERYRATMFGGVPTMYTLTLGHGSFPDRDTTSVRLAMVGGANADPTLCAAILKGFPNARLFNLYGLSEVSGACVMSQGDDDVDTVARTLGTPLDGMGPGSSTWKGGTYRTARKGSCWCGPTARPPVTGSCPRPPPRSSSATAGSPPGTSWWPTPTGTSPSRAGARRCSCRAGTTCIRSRWRTCSPRIPGWPWPPASACRTRCSGRSAATTSWPSPATG